MFLHHVATLDEDSIAYQVYCTQKRLMLPGLVEEFNEMLAKLQINDVTTFSTGQWKSLINKKIDKVLPSLPEVKGEEGTGQ